MNKKKFDSHIRKSIYENIFPVSDVNNVMHKLVGNSALNQFMLKY